MTKTVDERHEFFELLEHFDNAMLVTVSRDGSLHARPMRIAQARENGELWFVTSVDSAKAAEVAARVQCTVTMQSRSSYLTVSGRAELVRDPAKVKELWTDAWKPWFPDGPETPDIVLIRVDGEQAEYWDTSGVKGLRYAYKLVKATASGERPSPSDDQHAKVQL